MTRAGRGGLFALFGLLLLGCGDDQVGRVRGKVTLDGQPLTGAQVTFQPENNARPSVAVTDDSGHYELLRSPGVKGAAVGKHKVSITTGSEGDDDKTGKNVVIPEKVPAKYNVKTGLVKEVKPGSNEIDIELDSKGEVAGPGAPKRTRPAPTGCD